MPGPRNTRKQKKLRTEKDRTRSRKNVLNDVQQNILSEPSVNKSNCLTPETRLLDSRTAVATDVVISYAPQEAEDAPKTDEIASYTMNPVPIPHQNPFIVDPGNGPRIKDMDAFLSSFFCPSISIDDKDCTLFAREEIVTVLEAILPREIALIVWYNKTRIYGRICPACQRLYRLGDSLVDPISGELIDVNNPRTPPHIFREQQLSGICSFPCFFLASYSSHPYSTEVASGAWGLLSDELSPQVRSLLDATDPRTAAIMRYGLAACTPSQSQGSEDIPDDQSLGRVLRLTRRKDLGLGEVLEALAWYEREREDGRYGPQE